MARPTLYEEKYIEAAETYLATCKDEPKERKVDLPTIEGFARYIGVNKTTLYEWSKVHDEFSNALEKIKTEQQTRLINQGLSGTYNSTIAKLVLSANHNMREKVDTTTNDKDLPAPLLYALRDNNSHREGSDNEEADTSNTGGDIGG